MQLRADVAKRAAQVRVVNGSDTDLEITRLSFEDDWFAETAVRDRVSQLPAGRTLDLTIQLAPSECEDEPEPADRGSRVVIEYSAEGSAFTSTADLPDPLEVIPALHARECLLADLERSTAVAFTAFQPSETGQAATLTLTLTPTGEAASEVTAIQSTNLLTVGQVDTATDVYPLGVVVREGTTDPIVIDLPLVPCPLRPARRAGGQAGHDLRPGCRDRRPDRGRRPRRAGGDEGAAPQLGRGLVPVRLLAGARRGRVGTDRRGARSLTGDRRSRAQTCGPEGADLRSRGQQSGGPYADRMAQSSVAPHDPAAARGSSRRTQSEIYRAGISGTRPAVPVDADALEAAARKALSAEAFAYIAGGAGAERTVAANRRAFERWQVWPRPLHDVAERDLSIELLGRRRPTPFVLAPLGVMELAHRDADIAVAKAAASLGVPYTLSNQASFPMEDVAAAAPAGVRLFQLYWSANDELNGSLLRRAEASGCEAIVVTLDTHLLGWRTRDLDLAYLPFTRGLGIAQYTSDPVFQQLVRERVRTAGDPRQARGPRLAEHVEAPPPVRMTAKTVAAGIQIARKGSALTGAGLRDSLRSPLPRAAVETFLDVFSTPALTWTDLAKAREWTTLPIILKGILHPDDATRAMDAGVDGVWVSNHGGRQIDQSVPTLAALPGVVDRVGGAVPVIFDSGVRGGADAFIALALGATAVAIGRPYAYGLAIAGEAGVREVVRNHIAELDITLGLARGSRPSGMSGPTPFARPEPRLSPTPSRGGP